MPVLRAKGWEAAVTGEPVALAGQEAQARRELAAVVATALLWVPISRRGLPRSKRWSVGQPVRDLSLMQTVLTCGWWVMARGSRNCCTGW
jgi:hypothetical protein